MSRANRKRKRNLPEEKPKLLNPKLLNIRERKKRRKNLLRAAVWAHSIICTGCHCVATISEVLFISMADPDKTAQSFQTPGALDQAIQELG